MNNALLKRLGIKPEQVSVPTKATRGKKETTDSTFVKDVRAKMNMTYISHTTLASASYLEPTFKRDKDNNIVLDKDRKKVVDSWMPKHINGQYILEDNGDGTHTATKLNVYKETFIVDSESIQETKVSS